MNNTQKERVFSEGVIFGKQLMSDIPIVKVGIGIIVIRNGKILTGIRKGSHGEGRRAFPGGHIDPEDESLVHASCRELLEECGIQVNHRLIRGGFDFFTTFDILSEDGQKRYATIYMVADYVSGGDWIDEHTLRGVEPDKCENWTFHSLESLAKLVEAEGDQMWIPMDRIQLQRKELML